MKKKKEIKKSVETIQELVYKNEEYNGELIQGYVSAAFESGYTNMYELGRNIFHQLTILYY